MHADVVLEPRVLRLAGSRKSSKTLDCFLSVGNLTSEVVQQHAQLEAVESAALQGKLVRWTLVSVGQKETK